MDKLNEAFEVLEELLRQANSLISPITHHQDLDRLTPDFMLRDCQKNNLIDNSRKDAEPSFFKGSSLKSSNRNELINLQKLFYYAVKFPWLMPFIRLIIKLRPNIFFEFCFLVGYAISYMGSENLTMKEVFTIAKRNFIRFFFTRTQFGVHSLSL